MRNLISFAFVAVFAMLMAGCSHNTQQLGIGTAYRVGSGDAGMWYGDGLFLNNVSRENIRFESEIDSTNGFSYDPKTNSYKGIKSISLEVGPQLGGYAKELGEKNPEALKAYYDASAKYYEFRVRQGELPSSSKSTISDEKSKEATVSIATTIREAIDKAKSIISKRETDGGEGAVFQCDGNCEYSDLTGNSDIEYQLSIAMKLLSYDGHANKFKSTGETYTQTLEHFITQLVQYRALGNKTTPMRVKHVTVREGVITRLMYIYFKDDGTTFDVECPSCVVM